uniref:Uncharacterized protein n=1 Tax=Anopheles merus TaxID=30066 RepID=A0A182UX57_ANOME
MVVVVVVVARLGVFVLLDGTDASLGGFGGTIALLVVAWQEEVLGAGFVSAGTLAGGCLLTGGIASVSGLLATARLLRCRSSGRFGRRWTISFFGCGCSVWADGGGGGGGGAGDDGSAGGGGTGGVACSSSVTGSFSTGLGRTVGVTAFGGGDGRRPAELLYPPVDGLPRLYGGVPKSSMRMCVRFRLEVDRELAVPGTIGLSSGVALERGGSASITPAAVVVVVVVVAGGTFSSLASTGATWGGLVASSSVSWDACSVTVTGGGLPC